MSDARAGEISKSLRALFRRPAFKTKAKRMGKVIRVANEEINYYTAAQRQVRIVVNHPNR